jgi:hypothetical protein
MVASRIPGTLGGTYLAALGLEELDHGEGLEVDEAGGGMGVCGSVGDGDAVCVEVDCAG